MKYIIPMHGLTSTPVSLPVIILSENPLRMAKWLKVIKEQCLMAECLHFYPDRIGVTGHQWILLLKGANNITF
jgi:hypothetical protein